jgi:L-ascorbate metabolism protein UlaG (beta-lactamase superfamily)
MASSEGAGVRIETIGGPTVVLDYGGLRLVTDPTFDEPGEYPGRSGYSLVKTAPPSRQPDEVGEIDVVLLSHDQHPDNLDRSGRELLRRANRVLSTASAVERLGDLVAVAPTWGNLEIETADGRNVEVTAVPAQHGPDGSEPLVGEVIGFVLRGDNLPSIYVSGDNASLRVVEEIADRAGKIDVAILHAGGASTPLIPGEYLTLTSADAVRATEILGATRVLVVHTDSWRHFTEGADDVRKAFAQAGLSDRLIGCEPGLTDAL